MTMKYSMQKGRIILRHHITRKQQGEIKGYATIANQERVLGRSLTWDEASEIIINENMPLWDLLK